MIAREKARIAKDLPEARRLREVLYGMKAMNGIYRCAFVASRIADSTSSAGPSGVT